MTPTPQEPEPGVRIPYEVVSPMLDVIANQDDQRADWDNPRDAQQPEPPWPEADSPVLRYLLHRATASLEAGHDMTEVLLHLAAHAWFEGGVENYDRGQRDARRPRSV